MARKKKNNNKNRVGSAGKSSSGLPMGADNRPRPIPGEPQPGPHTWVPGNPGVPTPPVQPFWTAQDLAEIAQRHSEWDQQLLDIQSSLDNLILQSDFDKSQIQKSMIQDLSLTADEMAARGLFQSSIKDADMYDIESTARLRREFIDTQVKAATMDADRRRTVINNTRESFNTAMNQKKVENAQGVSAGMPAWQTEPTEGRWVPQYQSPQTAPKPPQAVWSGPQPAANPATPQIGSGAGSPNPNKPNQAGGSGQLRNEANRRMGKTGGRGRIGYVGAGSAGIS